MLLAIIIIGVFALGNWMGYWYGRTWQLYKSGQDEGLIGKNVTWSEYLESTRPNNRQPDNAVTPPSQP